MKKRQSSMRDHIVEVTRGLLSNLDGDEIHIADVTRSAAVGVQTIYYHFGSLNRLVAEARVKNYEESTRLVYEFLSAAELALSLGDEEEFWLSIGESFAAAWSINHDIGLRFQSLLHIEVWFELEVQRSLGHLVNSRFKRWKNVLVGAKRLEWIGEDVDVDTLVALMFAAWNGQAIFPYIPVSQHSARSVSESYIRALRNHPA